MSYALEVEVAGKIVGVRYSVQNEVVEVQTPCGTGHTRQGRKPAITVAKSLARSVILDAEINARNDKQ